MGDFAQRLEKAALLLGVGTLIRRAYPEKGFPSDEAAGEDFLRPFFDVTGADFAAAQGADFSRILREASYLAAGTEGAAAEDGAGAGGHLASVFNGFGDEAGSPTVFPVCEWTGDVARLPYPQSAEKARPSREAYQRLAEGLKEAFCRTPISQMTPEALATLLERFMSYVPSAEAADISLYDQAKVRAAFAVSLYHHLAAREVSPLAPGFSAEVEKLREASVYLFVTGDLSRIQKFLYTIPSKGALKSLRGRSFYLELFLEHAADEILAACGVSRNCLLYTGGGHFYLILPHTEKALAVLAAAEKSLNDWLLGLFGTKLSLALAWIPCSAAALGAFGGGCGQVFREVNGRLAEKKLRPYDEVQLHGLFSPKSAGNRAQEGARECAVCHRPAADLRPYGEAGDGEACEVCRGLFALGKAALEADAFLVSEKPGGEMTLPGLRGETLYLYGVTAENATSLPVRRRYVKNALPQGAEQAAHLWMGDYTAREAGRVLEFEALAAYSGGAREEKGIPRLGVLRADVDGLGAAFIAGFSREGGCRGTLARTTALSRQLSLFFKRYIHGVCAGNLSGLGEEDIAPFSLFGRRKSEKRLLHIVYSGGDDMFLVGAWDDIVEAAVDLRERFRTFTNDKLSFSAGIGFFKEKCPIAEMARQTGTLEDYAKANPGKDSVTLFGLSGDGQKEADILRQRYTWSDFSAKVCGEKLAFLRDHFCFAAEDDGQRIVIGKSGLYRLLSLLRGSGVIQLARFAYVLARLEPPKHEVGRRPCYEAVRRQLYDWYKSAEDRQMLLTALMFLIYSVREKEEK